jgi:hypothetical protein
VSEELALLLPSTAAVRFVPAPRESGQATLTYQAWDQTAGTAGTLFAVNGMGGAFALSGTEATATLTIQPINDAPTWTGTGPVLPPVAPGASDPSGATIDALFSANYSDANAGTTTGIAVTGLTGTGKATWQYSLDGGANWLPFGSVSSSAARLLSGLDQVRFLPASGFSGSVTLQADAWNGSSGEGGDTYNISARGGHTSFSASTLTATCPVDTSPVWTGSSVMFTPVLTNAADPPGQSVASVFGALLETDVTNATTGIAVSGATAGTQGLWQFSTDGGTTWTKFPAVSPAAALLLSGGDWIRFVPAKGFAGTVRLQAYA